MRRDVFQAIADPTRRAIITLLALQAMTPNTIAENFNTTRQSVSKHLRILTECELVKQKQHGREIYYSLELEKMKEVDKWLDQFRMLWETRFNQLGKVLSTIKKQKNKRSLFTVDHNFAINYASRSIQDKRKNKETRGHRR